MSRVSDALTDVEIQLPEPLFVAILTAGLASGRISGRHSDI